MLTIIKNVSVYSFGNILSTGIAFFLLPLYTRVLTPSDYGQLELIYLIASILVVFFGLNISLGYSRVYFIQKDIISRKKLFMSAQAFVLLCSIICCVVMYIYIGNISRPFLSFDQRNNFLKLITLATVMEVLGHVPANNLRVRNEAWPYVKASLLSLIVTVSFTVYFVVIIDMGVAGILYGRLIGAFLSLLYLHYLVRGEFVLRLSFKMILSMLSFSIFLIPSNLSSLVLNMSNRFFLSEYQNLEEVGLFSLGVKIAAVIPLLITEPVKKAFSPYIFDLADDPQKCTRVLSDFVRLFFAGISIFVLVISVFATDLVAIMAPESYQGSSSSVFVLSFSNLILGTAAIVVLAIHITKKTWIVTLIWVFSSVLNIFLNVLLIPGYGKMGAAYATLISIIFILIAYIIAARKVFPLIIPYQSILKVCFLLVVFYLIGQLIAFGILINICLKSCLVMSYLLTILYVTDIVRNDEISRLRSYLRFKLLK